MDRRKERNKLKRLRYSLRGYREPLAEKQNWLCFWCREKMTPQRGIAEDTAVTVDHKVPRSRGGSDKLPNLVAACTRCNQRRNVESKLGDGCLTRWSNVKDYELLLVLDGLNTLKELRALELANEINRELIRRASYATFRS